MVIYRFDAPLIFANANNFRDEVRRISRTKLKPQWLVIAAEPITNVDTTAADMLLDLDQELYAENVNVVVAELKDPVRRKVERYGLTRQFAPECYYPTIGAAVSAFREETGAVDRNWP